MSFGPAFNPLNINFSSPSVSQLLLVPSGASSGSNSTSISTTPAIPPEMSAETLRILAAGQAGLGPMAFGPPHIPTSMSLGPPGMPPFGLYPGMPAVRDLMDLKSAGGDQVMHPQYFFDPMAYPYGGPLDLNGARRKNATRETTQALKAWLYEHRKNPYPTKGEKIMLAIMTKMTMTQVSTWFANARRRLKKENKMTWSPRNRPGEDDDDPSGDRPSSSLSDASLDDVNTDGTIMIKDDKKDISILNSSDERSSPCSLKRSLPEDPAEVKIVPEIKKPKIWSIAETCGEGSSGSQPTTSNSPSPTNGPKKPDSSGPFHYTFNPWQHQMQTLMAGRPPMMLSPGAGNPGPSGLPFPPFPFPTHPLAAQIRPEIWGAMARSGAFGLPGQHHAFMVAAQQQQAHAQAKQHATTVRSNDSSSSPVVSKCESPIRTSISPAEDSKE